MKKTSIVLSISFIIGSISCKPAIVNNEVSFRFDELCITDKNKYETPIKLEDLINVEGLFFEKKGIPNSIFYIKANNNLYSSCKLSNEFKKEGLKIVFSGTSYRLSFICKSGEACPSFEAIPLIISHINTK